MAKVLGCDAEWLRTVVSGIYVKRSRTLIQAVKAGDSQSVRTLLDQGADTNVRDRNGLAPLHLATLDGHHDIVVRLVSAGADVDIRDKFGRTPLHHAVFGGHKSVVAYLLLHGADAEVRGDSGISPLDLAHAEDNSNVQGNQEFAPLLTLTSVVSMDYIRHIARSLSRATMSRRSRKMDELLVVALLEEMGIDTRIEPLVTAALEEIWRDTELRHPSAPSPRVVEPETQRHPLSDSSASRRAVRFTGTPAGAAQIGRSWVVSGSDPSINAGDIYAFKESDDFEKVFKTAARELADLEVEDSITAVDLFDEYFHRVGQLNLARQRSPSDFHDMLEAALMLYTDDRFFRILNDCWRRNRSSDFLGFSTLMIMAFEHAEYFIEGEVYRGVDLADVDLYKPGLVFRWPFFLSASTNRNIAAEFGKTLVVIEVPASGNVRNIAYCSLFPEEGEVLFHPYEVFEVVSADLDEVRVKISEDEFFGMPGWEVSEQGEIRFRD